MICLYFVSTTTIYQHFCTYLAELYLYLYLYLSRLPKKVKFCLPIRQFARAFTHRAMLNSNLVRVSSSVDIYAHFHCLLYN